MKTTCSEAQEAKVRRSFLLQSAATWEQLWEEKEGAVASISGNEGGITQAWVNVRGGMRVFSAYSWHSEGRTPRYEALWQEVLKRARMTRHPWLLACDANMNPVDFENSLWLRKNQMHVVDSGKASACRSENVRRGEWVEEVYDYVIACNSLKGKISQMKVVEDFRVETT